MAGISSKFELNLIELNDALLTNIIFSKIKSHVERQSSQAGGISIQCTKDDFTRAVRVDGFVCQPG